MKKHQWIAGAAIALTVAISAGTAQASAQTHTVVKNDTFWKLAQQYNVALKELMEANSSLDPLNLQIGAKLAIPGKQAAAAKSAEPEQAPAALAQVAQPATPTVTTPAGNALAYTKQLKVKATAYTAAASENGKWGPVDYFGNSLKVGTVAVDPQMIPLGTKLYVTGYSFPGLPQGGMVATALDMGGSIKGNRIDIFVPGTTRQALTFGIQDVEVYILEQ